MDAKASVNEQRGGRGTLGSPRLDIDVGLHDCVGVHGRAEYISEGCEISNTRGGARPL